MPTQLTIQEVDLTMLKVEQIKIRVDHIKSTN